MTHMTVTARQQLCRANFVRHRCGWGKAILARRGQAHHCLLGPSLSTLSSDIQSFLKEDVLQREVVTLGWVVDFPPLWWLLLCLLLKAAGRDPGATPSLKQRTCGFDMFSLHCCCFIFYMLYACHAHGSLGVPRCKDFAAEARTLQIQALG